MWLYEQIGTLKTAGIKKELPQFVKDNLNPNFEVRPYQTEALENFITYYETPNLYAGKNVHTLFHMATGSGKTFVMAGIIIYLYSKGYRNFLFFVNLSQIVKKTEDNFLNPVSLKYLFSNEIKIEGKTVHINQVNNFQECNPNDINILFSTTAGLHSDMTLIKENSISIDDFLTDKTVLIADEAHHLNTATKSQEDEENEHSWETTVNKIKDSNKENVMLEFTATCDLANSEIVRKYQDKIIFDYDLAKFRKDKYSKDIFTLRSDFPQTQDGRLYRSLQALIVSQYKLKMFQEMKKNVKPVVLFKSKTIKESKENKELILSFIKKLTVDDINQIRIASSESELMQKIFAYFSEKNITDEALVSELQLAFNEDVCIDVNDTTEADSNQLIVNSLEDETNPYRIIFEVEKLDEGWDCLNLFDIVRLYETRDSKGDKPGKSTIREAQLIGRGARYFPFEYEDKDKYKRKFDSDVNNPYRVCEQLHYHCQNDSRYVNELNNALREFGITDADEKNKVHVHNDLKASFKNEQLYLTGFVFVNEPINQTYKNVDSLTDLSKNYSYDLTGGRVNEDLLLENEEDYSLHTQKVSTRKKNTTLLTFYRIANEINYNLLYSIASSYKIFTFEKIKALFPEVNSMKDFLINKDYLGNIEIAICSFNEVPTIKELTYCLKDTFAKIDEFLSQKRLYQCGSTTFIAKSLKIAFNEKGTDRNYTIEDNDGDGIPQKECRNTEMKFDLSDKNWYAYEENYGTTEEKRFVKYFAEFCIPKLQASGKYDIEGIRLLRNECQIALYDFTTGNKFEPDYLLFLKNKDSGEYEYTQVFIEPKGEHLLDTDKWKENFLLNIKDKAELIEDFGIDSKYKIWGLHFYCHDISLKNFEEDIVNLCK